MEVCSGSHRIALIPMRRSVRGGQPIGYWQRAHVSSIKHGKSGGLEESAISVTVPVMIGRGEGDGGEGHHLWTPRRQTRGLTCRLTSLVQMTWMGEVTLPRTITFRCVNYLSGLCFFSDDGRQAARQTEKNAQHVSSRVEAKSVPTVSALAAQDRCAPRRSIGWPSY